VTSIERRNEALGLLEDRAEFIAETLLNFSVEWRRCRGTEPDGEMLDVIGEALRAGYTRGQFALVERVRRLRAEAAA
jgi:hypothetical protein